MDAPRLSLVLERTIAGDSDAFAELYRHFHPRVLRLCRYLLGSEHEAEDAANDVFARLEAAMKTYDLSLPFPRWLLSVASNHCLDLLRRRRSERRVFEVVSPVAPEAATPGPSPFEELLSAEAQETLRAALATLPERYRVPLALRYYNDFSYDEIAAALGQTRSNVAVLIFRAKKELRAILARKSQSAEQVKP